MNDYYFDVVICVGPNDNDIIKSMIPYSKKNIIGYRNIYLVCANPTINIEGTITIDEKIFPFNINDLIQKFGKHNRNGWYLQQLLKIYSGNVIPGILSNYLIVDSDTHFLKPTSFIDRDGKYIYTTGTEYHKPYFNHMNKLHPSLKKAHPCSGIVHHMIVNNNILNALIKIVETNHNNNPFWKIFINMVDPVDFPHSGASEYEIYFNYMNIYHQNDIIIRELNWKNASSINNDNKDCDYVSIHWYMRK